MNLKFLAPREWQEWETRLLDEDEDARYAAARELVRTAYPTLPQLKEWIQSTDARRKEIACWFMGLRHEGQGQIVHERAMPLLCRLLEKDRDPNVRCSAAVALGRRGDVAAIRDLLRAANDPSGDVRYDVASALGSFGQNDWVENPEWKIHVQNALLKLMSDPDKDVRNRAAFGIHHGDHDTPEARAQLWKALDDEDQEVRGEAAEGLAAFGDRTFLPRLIDLFGEQQELSLYYFEAARRFGDPALLPAVLEAAERWRSLNGADQSNTHITSAIEALQAAAQTSGVK